MCSARDFAFRRKGMPFERISIDLAKQAGWSGR